MGKDEALKIAFEALESADWYIDQLEMIVYSVDDDGTHENRAKVQAAITAIKEALAQPAQKAVAWAGVKVWVGNQQMVWLLTQTELHYAVDPWLLVELNALKCIAALKEKNA